MLDYYMKWWDITGNWGIV